MAITGSITTRQTISGASVTAGGGTNDHTRLTNRDAADQHPISAIQGLQKALDQKLDSETAMPIIEEAIKTKAKGLYYGPTAEFPDKNYWYLTSEIDEETGQGTLASIISGPYELGTGGGGGGGGGVTEITLLNTNPETGEALWPGAVSLDATTTIGIYWTSLRAGKPTGAGTMLLYINDELVSKKAVKQGQIDYDITQYLKSGDNKIEFKVTDAYSSSTNIIGNVTGVSLKLTSSFEDDVSYTGDITYTYTPVGDVTKIVHFIVDGVDVGTDTVKTTGEQRTRMLKAMSHGAHTLEVYFVATLDGEEVRSNTLKYDLITYTAGNSTPIIASTFDAESEQEQYVSFSIPFRVYTPGKNTSTVYMYINGERQGEPLSCDITWHSWEYRPTVIGQYVMKIQTGKTSRSFDVHVSESTIKIQPVTENLALELNSVGRSNSETPAERLKWQDKDHAIDCKLSGFNWSSNGWVQDDDGNTVLRLSGDARVDIPYQPFAKDLQQTGKTIEIEFATSDVKKYESKIVKCLGEQESDSLTYNTSLAGEDDRLKIFKVTDVDPKAFIAKVSGQWRTYIFVYKESVASWTLDGASVDLGEGNEYGITIETIDRGAPEDSTENFFIEGDRITVVYEVVGRGIYITPQLAKFQSQLSSLSTQYKENEHVRLSFVIEKRSEHRVIYMYINGIMSGITRYPAGDTFIQTPASDITLGSNDATLDIYQIRVYDNDLNRKQVVNNWIADMRDPVEKAVYYQENDNFDETGEVVISKLPSKTPYMILNGPELPQYKGDKKELDVEFVYPGEDDRNFTSTAATVNVQGTSSQYYYRKNFKIKFQNGFTDSEGETDKKYKIIPPLAKKEKTFTFKADVASSEGANNVELVRYFEKTKNWLMPAEKDQDPDDTADGYDTKDRVRAGIDGFPIVMFQNDGASTHFYGKMNFNNDKSNDDTYGFTEGDECWEFINNTTPLVLFQTDNMKDWQTSFESRYPEEAGSDEHTYGTGEGELTKLTEVVKWVYSTARLDTDTEAQKAAKLKKFRNELKKHFDLESTLFYYLYTELFLMVDSWGKNAMMAYLRSHQPGDGGGVWFWLPYDMDTAIGTNNEGLLVFDYDAEDTDIINGANVYNAQNSVFWNNVRDAFPDELRDRYEKLRNGTAGGDEKWSYANIEQMFEDHQAKWSASIFNEDAYVKYLTPLFNDEDATYLGMAQGSKEQQRKWWLYNRFRYLDSKYLTGDAKGKTIMIRAYQRSNLHITPYINSYITAVFDQAKDGLTVTKSCEKDKEYEIVPPENWDPKGADSVLSIYSADVLKDIGDISGLKAGYADFSQATKLQRLQIGSASASYSNEKLEGINVGSNRLLTYIDARNCSHLGTGDRATPIIDLSNCTSIEEAYFDNTNLKGVSFPVGGNLKSVHLPATITDLTIRNHPNLTDLKLYGTQSLTSVWLEDIPSSVITARGIVSQMSEGSTVRLIGIDENVDSVDDIKAFYDQLDLMKGKDAKGDTTDKAQVTGVLHINNILYSDYVELSARYDEIKIDAKIIVCIVNFYNEGEKYATQSVYMGEAAETPEEPAKAPTQKNYWTFNSWDADFSDVQSDMDIHAIYDEHIQVYRVTFNPQSTIIDVAPQYEDVDYGSLAHEPEVSNVPQSVTLTGWFRDDGTKFVFDQDKILDNIELLAKWDDPEKPSIDISRKSFDTFEFTATDNVGIIAWAVTRTDSEPAEADWTSIESASPFTMGYQIDEDYWWVVWVKDAQGNNVHAQTRAYKIEYVNEEGKGEFALQENGSILSGYALSGTETTLLATLDPHYENMRLSYCMIDDLGAATEYMSCQPGDSFTVTSDLRFKMEADRKSYDVVFHLGDKGTASIDAQRVVYLHYATEPDPQYDDGFLVTGWYRDEELTDRFDFKTMPVESDLSLYAKWEEYHDPTILTIRTENANQDVTVNMELIGANAEVDIDFNDGDGKEDAVKSDDGYVHAKHVYAEPGEHTISIYLMKGRYRLGINDTMLAVAPIECLTKVAFAWDVSETNSYAFDGAVNLEEFAFTDYMTSIAIGMFRNCAKVKSLTIPKNIQSIGFAAFYGCSGIETPIVVDNKLSSIGNYAFSGCSSIPSVTVLKTDCTFSERCFENCTSIKEVPSNIAAFSKGMFAGCTSITNVDLSEKVESLGGGTFQNCSAIEKVTIRNKSMKFLNDGGDFVGCMNLKTAGPIPQSESDPSYDIEFAFDEEIPDNAFSFTGDPRLDPLVSIDIPSTVTRIGDRAFAYCMNLDSIELPDGVTSIGHDAFAQCRNLVKITIPSKAHTIGSNALFSCLGLDDVYLYPRTVDAASKANDYSNSWFNGCSQSTTVHIPTDLVDDDAAQAAYGSYWNYIDETKWLGYVADIS